MSHIFISYSKQDIDFARYLRTLLESSIVYDKIRDVESKIAQALDGLKAEGLI